MDRRRRHHFSKNYITHDLVFWSVFTVSLAVIIGIFALNPLWSALAAPGTFPDHIKPPITAPVDGMYYLRNAKLGYQWKSLDPFSLWFHPLLVILLRLFPSFIPPNYSYWLLSVIFSLASLPLVYRLINVLSGEQPFLPRWALLIILLAPGGLILATGNAEVIALFFNLVLLLSVLRWQNVWITMGAAALTILAKPNALYMVPVLMVYFFGGLREDDQNLRDHALLGTVGILVFWLIWTWVVDYKTQVPGSYWNVRLAEKYYVGAGNYRIFFENLFDAFSTNGTLRNRVRFSTAILVPFVSLVILGATPLKKEYHRYALAAGIVTMLAIALFLGNPNKITVYVCTLPSHFVVHILLLFSLIQELRQKQNHQRLAGIVAYTFYCVVMLIVFIVGTPLGWYY